MEIEEKIIKELGAMVEGMKEDIEQAKVKINRLEVLVDRLSAKKTEALYSEKGIRLLTQDLKRNGLLKISKGTKSISPTIRPCLK